MPLSIFFGSGALVSVFLFIVIDGLGRSISADHSFVFAIFIVSLVLSRISDRLAIRPVKLLQSRQQ
ncbi:MAG: hypothetical protein CMM80_05990 [Rhodospirillaceae bacterium]|nr:hypothetical protein [Rhodospirillaceae bacterium]